MTCSAMENPSHSPARSPSPLSSPSQSSSSSSSSSPSSLAEYPPPTDNELALMGVYLHKYPLEDREYADDSEYEDYDDNPERFKFISKHELAKKFLKEVRESRGYDVTCVPPLCMGSPFIPRLLKYNHEEAKGASEFAIGEINKQMAEMGSRIKYEFVEVLKGVETRNLMILLTFTAKEVVDSSDDDSNLDAAVVRTFQAMVYLPLPCFGEDRDLVEWRFKPVPVSTGIPMN